MDGDLAWTAASVRSARPIYFGAACSDPAAQRLTVDGQEVALEQRSMALLALLLARHGQAVSKEQILDALWPGRLVTEASLTKCVSRLRAAIGDADHGMIRTLHGLGYRFDADLTEPPSPLAEPVPQTEPQLATPVPQRVTPAARARALPQMTALLGICVLVCVALGAGLALTRYHPGPEHLPPSPQARTLYMSGLQDWSERTPAGLTRAVEEFTAALRLAPNYAEAYVGLATCYDLLPEYAAMPSAQAYPLAREAALHALALGPDLAAAHAAYAFTLFWGDWRFADAMAEYERALRLKPDDAVVQHWYANSLDTTGAHAQALVHIERALEFDPASPSIQADRGLILFNAGRVAEARSLLLGLEARLPDFLPSHAYLADIALAAGDDATYLREKSTHLRLQHDAAGAVILQAAEAGFAASGRAGMRRAVLAARLAEYAAGSVSAADVARAYASSGDLGHALAYLSLAIDRHDASVISLLNDPEWRRYMAEPGMAPLLARLGLAWRPG